MNLTLRRCFDLFWLLSVLITRTTDGMLKDNIDIMCLRSLLRQEGKKGLARGHTKIKSWSLERSKIKKGC